MGNHIAIHDQHPASPAYMGKEEEICYHCDKPIFGTNYGNWKKSRCERCNEELEAFRLEYYEEEFHPGDCQFCDESINDSRYCRVDNVGHSHINCVPEHFTKYTITII